MISNVLSLLLNFNVFKNEINKLSYKCDKKVPNHVLCLCLQWQYSVHAVLLVMWESLSDHISTGYISNYMQFMYCTVNIESSGSLSVWLILTWNSICPFSLNHSQVANIYCWLEPDEKEDWVKCLLPIRSLQFTILHEWNFTGNNHEVATKFWYQNKQKTVCCKI